MKKIHNAKSTQGISLRTKGEMSFMAFLLLPLMLLLIFEYYPILMGVFASFFSVNIVDLPGKFVGFANYARVFHDKEFYMTVYQTIKHYVYELGMAFWPPILCALLVNEVRGKVGKAFFRTIYYLPAVAPSVAMLVFWKFFWNPDYGLANQIISVFGLEKRLWLNEENLVYFCMHFQGLVLVGGMNMLIYLAAMQDIPNEQYEAALIDGAGFWKRFRYITFPGIKGVVGSLFLLSVVGAFNRMEDVLVLTGGGPYGKTQTVLSHAYEIACEGVDYAYAITVSTVLFMLVLVIGLVVNKLKTIGKEE